MTFKQRHTRLSSRRRRSSLIRAVFLLCLGVMPLALFSQVISNKGAAISVSPGIAVSSKDAVNTSSGIISNGGTISLSGNYSNAATSIGDGTYSIGGNFTNTGSFYEGNSTVIFNGSHNQSIIHVGETFYNLSINNTGPSTSDSVGLLNNITVRGTLSMQNGNFNTAASKLYLFNSIPAALNYTSVTGSRVLGKFERGINPAGTYLFPMGTSAYYNPANFTIGAPASTSGTMLSEFITSAPGNSGLPLPDPPVEVDSTFINGYWSFKSTGFSSGNYNINLDGTGFTEPVKDITRVVTRINGSPWTVAGAHRDASGLVAFRDNLAGISSSSITQFALAKANPLITSNPIDLIACEKTNPVFTITATGTGPLTFRWYKDGVIITNSSHYTGNRTASLTINNAVLTDAGTYYCVVRDRDGNTTISLSATLIVNKIPVATVSNSVQGDECSNYAFKNMVLGESYGVPGTSYIWSRNNPSGITSSVPMNGTAPNIGDVLSGSFTNSLDVPVTVTFTITPVGPNFYNYVGSPSYTNCVGVPVQANITVNPTPRVIAVNSQICYGGSTTINLVSPSQMTQPNVIKFDYNTTATAPPAIVPGNYSTDVNVAYGTVLSMSYSNKSDTLQSVYYNITPTAIGLCPAGVEVPFEIKVHPLPLQKLLMPKTLTCDGGSDAILTAVLAKGTSPFNVLWTGPFSYHVQYTTSAASTNAINLKGGRFDVVITDNLGCTNNGSQIITGARLKSFLRVIPRPANGLGTTCTDSPDGELWIQETVNSTGIAPFKYAILYNNLDTVIRNTLSTTGVYQKYPNLRPGNYKLFMNDANGCINTDFPEVDIVGPDTIKVEFDKKVYPGGFNITCKNKNDGSVSVKTTTGGNGGYTYKWYPAIGTLAVSTTTSLLDSIPAGKYYLITTDRLGCMKTDSVTLSEPSGMQLTGSELSISRDGNTNVSCNGGSDGFIKLSITGGSGNNTYSWISPNGYSGSSKDIFGLKAGDYEATVTDQTGCVLRLLPGSVLPKFTLTEPTPLAVVSTISTSADGGYNINCNGGKTGWINITVSGGSTGTYKYNWSTTDGSGIVNGQKNQSSLSAGTYNLSVTDSNNCVITKSFTLTQPPVFVTQISATNITCQSPGFNNGSVNLTVSGGVAPYSYLWSNGAITEDLNGLTQGLYQVTVSYNGSCSKKDSARISVPPPLKYTRVLSDYNGYNVSCFGMANGSIRVTPTSGLAPFVYTWTGPSGFTASTQDILGLKAGQYVLTVTDNNLCSATEIINLTEPGKLGMTFSLSASNAGGYNLNCAGDNNGFIGIEPLNQVKSVSYLWADGIFGKTRTNLTAGNYSVIITDGNSCYASSVVTLREPDSLKNVFDITPPLCPDKPDGEIRLKVTGGVKGTDYTYLWSDNSTNPTLSNIPRGYYKVSIRDMNGCSIRDSVNIESRNETCLVIPNAISANGDLINDVWNIGEIELYPNMEINIINRWGESVWRSDKGYAHPWDGTSNGAPLPIDSYHYIIDLHNGSKPIVGSVTIVR
jgi:gliding motility-associated-like protein